METVLILLSLAVPPAQPQEDVYVAPQESAPVQMLYDATPQDIEQLEPAPLVLAQENTEEVAR